MFDFAWSELALIAVVALVVIGPKDLPVVMSRLGKMVATIRRMGTEFQREINKTTGLDQVVELRRSITEPLKKTAAELTREFNKPLSGGRVEPSGAIKPAVAGSESVVDEIHKQVGMTPPAAVESPAPVEALAPAKPKRKPRAKKADEVVVAADAPAKKPAARKKRTPKADA